MQSLFLLALGFLVNAVHSFIGGFGGGFGGIGLGLGYGWWGGYPGFGFPWLAPPLGYQINSGSIFGSPGVGFYDPGDRRGSYSGGSSSYSGGDTSYSGGSSGGPVPGSVPPVSPDIQNKASPSAPGNLISDNTPAKSMPGVKSGVQGATLAAAQSGAPVLGNNNENGPSSGTGGSGTGTGGGSASGSSGGGGSGSGSGGGGGGGGGSGR